MRAIFDCNFGKTVELNKVLESCYWLPASGIQESELQKQRELIIDTLPKEIHERVRSTIKYVIFDRATETWGIASEEILNKITFRLKNSDGDRLRKASDRLIEELDRYAAQSSKVNAIELPDKIDVYQANTPYIAFSGKVVSIREGTIKIAIKNKATETKIVMVAFVLFCLGLLCTSPIINPDETIRHWVFGNLDRFTTGMLVTLTAAGTQIIFHWTSLRQQVLNNEGKVIQINWNE